MTPMEFILRFTFSNPDPDTTIVGTANPAHLQDMSRFWERAIAGGSSHTAKRRLADAGSRQRVADRLSRT